MRLLVIFVLIALHVRVTSSCRRQCPECPMKVGVPLADDELTTQTFWEFLRIYYRGLFTNATDVGLVDCEIEIISNEGMATVSVWKECKKAVSDGNLCCESCTYFAFLSGFLSNGVYPVNFPWLDIYQIVRVGLCCGPGGECQGACTQQGINGYFLVSSVPITTEIQFLRAVNNGSISYQSVKYPGYCKCVGT